MLRLVIVRGIINGLGSSKPICRYQKPCSCKPKSDETLSPCPPKELPFSKPLILVQPTTRMLP